MNKRIILTGPAAAGKDFIKTQFRNKGFICDVSYTTRPPRKGEIFGVDYHFITDEQFKEKIKNGEFYEWAEHGIYYYGTGLGEWKYSQVFIMEAHGVSKIKPEDRKDCVVIYIKTHEGVRMTRLKARGWTIENIQDRFIDDCAKFENFKDYDFTISSE